MTFRKGLLFILLFSASCNHIETGDTLERVDIERIQKLNLLDEGERILSFYSEFKNEVAGNFFTDRRISKYWIDENDKLKNEISYAFYPNIISIDTVYDAGATYCPYMLITRTDGYTFKVCIGGKRLEIKMFFEEALRQWRQHRNIK